MDRSAPATRIDLADFKSPAMRAFHVTWVAFFLCFFAWFAIAPLMPVVRAELAQVTQFGARGRGFWALEEAQVEWCRCVFGCKSM